MGEHDQGTANFFIQDGITARAAGQVLRLEGVDHNGRPFLLKLRVEAQDQLLRALMFVGPPKTIATDTPNNKAGEDAQRDTNRPRGEYNG